MKSFAFAIGLMAFATIAQANDIRVKSPKSIVMEEIEFTLNGQNCELSWAEDWKAGNIDDYCDLKLNLPKGGTIILMEDILITSNANAASSVVSVGKYKDGRITFSNSGPLSRRDRASIISKILEGQITVSAIYAGPRLSSVDTETHSEHGGASITSQAFPENCAKYPRDHYGRFIDPMTGLETEGCNSNFPMYKSLTETGNKACNPNPDDGCAGLSRCYPGQHFVSVFIEDKVMCLDTTHYNEFFKKGIDLRDDKIYNQKNYQYPQNILYPL